MQPEHPVDRAQLGRLDQLRMRDRDREQRALELLFPKRQEVLQGGKVRKQVVVLPRVALQQLMAIGPAIENFRRGQTVAEHLFPEVLRNCTFSVHANLLG